MHAAGGEVVRDNQAIGLLTVKAPANGFVEKVSASKDVAGAARAKPIGHAPAQKKAEKAKRDNVEKENTTTAANKAPAAPKSTAGMDPLDGDLIEPGRELLVTVRPKALLLCVPQPDTDPDLAHDADRARREADAIREAVAAQKTP